MTIRLCTLIISASVLGNAETFSADVYPIVRARVPELPSGGRNRSYGIHGLQRHSSVG